MTGFLEYQAFYCKSYIYINTLEVIRLKRCQVLYVLCFHGKVIHLGLLLLPLLLLHELTHEVVRDVLWNLLDQVLGDFAFLEPWQVGCFGRWFSLGTLLLLVKRNVGCAVEAFVRECVVHILIGLPGSYITNFYLSLTPTINSLVHVLLRIMVTVVPILEEGVLLLVVVLY